MFASTDVLPDFSQPRDLSDVVLVVEEQRFHVHRSMLAMWSPVFSTMFSSQFKEQTADEIPLPEKKAAEIKEMLQVIYPTSEKQVDRENYLFLLKLAKEYMMTRLTNKCEDFLVAKEERFNCLQLLDVAQVYELKKLEKACVEKASSLNFSDLKRNSMFPKINYSNYRAIVDNKIKKMEREIRNQSCDLQQREYEIKLLKSKGLEARKLLEYTIANIVFVIDKTHSSGGDIDSKLRYISYSGGEFKNLHGSLRDLYNKLNAFADQ